MDHTILTVTFTLRQMSVQLSNTLGTAVSESFPSSICRVIFSKLFRDLLYKFHSVGHAHAWFGIPGLLTQCHDDNWEPYDEYGPMNPARETTFSFLRRFLSEVFRAFPEKYIHIGGDEVQFYCWRRNPEVVQFMADNGWGTNWGRLEQYFIERVINESQVETEFKKTFIIWQEIIDDNATLPRSTIVQIWKDDYAAELSHVSWIQQGS
jgi:hexosaminidase